MARMFDEAELLGTVDNDLEFLAETVGMLAADGPPLVARIRDAIAAGDAGTVGGAAHTLKGMVANFCAPGVRARALELERMGRSGALDAAAPAVDAADRELRELIDELHVFLRARA